MSHLYWKARTIVDNLRMYGFEFYNGVRVQMLLDRSNNNINKGSKRWVNKLISYNKDSMLENVEKLLLQQEAIGNPAVRLYSCVNARKMDHAIRMFQHKMIDLPWSDGIERQRFFRNLNSEFVSCLMKPENSLRAYYMLDLDCDKSVPAYVQALDHHCKIHNLPVLTKRETPNGFHYILAPFDVRIFENYNGVEVKQDGLVILNVLEQSSAPT